ncbi:UNVERIFIED_CONTAM: hypothetical protein RF653_14780 [Kocuria sp. CPCC 205316]|uniref:hypothetical protein n=1 Tax=Kocuria TaxID=57493 RepID=UPI0036DEDDE3
MSVEIDEHGTVTANGRPVDYATAYAWCVDSPETITELVRDTKAFATVIAAAEHAGPEEQAEAVRRAFAAGVPRQPGASWTEATPPEPATEEPPTEEPATEEPATEEPATEDPAAEEPIPAEGDPVSTRSGPESHESTSGR